MFDSEIQSKYNFDDLWEIICEKIIKRVYLILKNSAGQVTQANEGLRKHKIYIGGDLLQRGVTFPSLVTTYFSRWAKDSGNMDTNLQRARWFGYRGKWIDLCKIFTSETIAREFTNLSEIETDLWEQFYSIQSGEMQIDEILIRADNTKQKPTRKNVAAYNAVAFRNKWIKQRVGIFDKNQIAINNALVDDMLSACEFQNTSAGRADGETTAQYTIIERDKLSKLIDHMQAIFDLEPFERRPLIDLIESSGEIPVIMMNDVDGTGRKRSFIQTIRYMLFNKVLIIKIKTKRYFWVIVMLLLIKIRLTYRYIRLFPKRKIQRETLRFLLITLNICLRYMYRKRRNIM